MLKATLALAVVLSVLVAESSCKKQVIHPTYRPQVPDRRPTVIYPTYKPPPRRDIIRFRREATDPTPLLEEEASDLMPNPGHEQEQQLNRPERSLSSPSSSRGRPSTSSGSRDTSHTHPGYIRRNARSVDSPSAKRGGGGPRTSSGSRNTGPTHPGYNRRNARDIRPHPKPAFPRPSLPAPAPRNPILSRTARDLDISGLPKKPTHRDVIIPNWNPNARTNPWNRIGGRHGRSLDDTEDLILDDQSESAENQRNVRSVDSPSARRGGGSPRTSSGSRNTGPTHPGYNRRNTREIRLPGHQNPLRPKPLYPRPTFPAPVPRIPILARTARDLQIPGMPKKPTHRDVVVPNWNPNAKPNAWNKVVGRHRRSLDDTEASMVEDEFVSLPHERVARDLEIPGMPKKPTHRDVVVPNWNPHARPNAWNKVVGRHRRSLDDTEALMVEDEFVSVPHERVARDLEIPGMPKKPTHRDVVVPNWNPHARPNAWNKVVGRHRRSLDSSEDLMGDDEFESMPQ